jgi:hypothetical protein
MSEPNPERDAILQALDDDKQERYDSRIARIVMKHYGLSVAQIVTLNRRAKDTTGEDITPQWLCDQLSCPVIFRAVKDFRFSKDDGFPNPAWLMDHFTLGRFAPIWTKLWDETLELHGRDGRSLAVCFRPKWASGDMVLHEYLPVTRYSTPGKGVPFMLFRPTVRGAQILQYLKPMLEALSSYWKPDPLEWT